MPPFPRLQAGFVLLLVWETACQKRKVAVPLPPPPAASQPAPVTAPAAAAASPAPSSTAPKPVTTTHAQEPTPYQINKPPQPAPAPKKPARSTPAPPPPPAPAPPPAAAPAPEAPPPKLGDILTADETKQYLAAVDESLARAQTSLNSVNGRQLNKDQQAQVEQIRNFMQQAQGSRDSDPAGAKSLAERAEVLARDLAATFR